MKNSSLIIILSVLICGSLAQVLIPPGYKEKYPNLYPWVKSLRHPRDVTWNKQVGDGKVFGTLGSNDQGLFGKGGYKETIFNDGRGKLEGQAYGTRVLSPNGDSSHFGGRLDWSNKDANAALDVTKQIGGKTSVSASEAGKWALDKNTELSAGGAMSHAAHAGRGKPDVAVEAKIEHKF